MAVLKFSQMSAKTKSTAVPISWTLIRVLPWLLFIGGLVGVIASLALSIERFDALANPHYRPVCNLNPIFSCSTVSSSHQAKAFGFYNPFVGLPGYGAVAAIGVAMLAGAKFKRWFWQLTQLGLTLAVAFITWLQFQTLYRIGALCLFCMIAWVATIPIFWYTTLYNLRVSNLPVSKKYKRPVEFLQRHHGDILLVWFLIIIALILKRFWYYWSTLL
ncbi:MAG TPA: vitamin K epoxide reductase family protein [Candidatus Saccharimonadales bacterium]|nr:vitamin K epoxide reductase family protein [Candidatus Saccharimonadales bacterium]